MKAKFLILILLVLATFYAKAQDPAIAGINPDASPIHVGETTVIQADVLNGSSAAIPLANQGTWTINLPPNVSVESVVMDDPSTSAFLSIYIGTYDPADGTIIQIIADKGPFPGGSVTAGAYVALITVKGVKITTPGSPAPMSINAVSEPALPTNNSGNDNTSSSIVVIPSLPLATDDNATVTGIAPVTINLLGNDVPSSTAIAPATPASATIVPTSVKLIDPSNGTSVTTLVVPNEGTYVVNPDGTVSFTRIPTFNGNTTPVKYTYTDSQGNTSNQANITITVTPLPVTLISFSVAKEGKVALLNWATTAETNSDRFEIQHSLTGKDWNKIGTVASSGESSVKVDYSFTDKNVSNGENLYRLKMIDKDASFAYSRIQSITFDGLNAASVSIYPNPSADRVFIQDTDLTQVKQVSIMDMNGRAVFSSNSVNSNGINVSKFPSGTYILHITNLNGSVSNHKIVVAK